MKLYGWRPKEYWRTTFYVMAESAEIARALILKESERGWVGPFDYPDEYEEIEEIEAGQVLTSVPV